MNADDWGSGYIICTSPRSGSWLLSDALARTRIAGNPREWFNPQQEHASRSRMSAASLLDPTFGSYFDEVAVLASSVNGVRGAKLHFSQLARLSARLHTIDRFKHLTDQELPGSAFRGCRYIWLSRENKERQAISYVRALTTRQWWVLKDAADREHETVPDFALDMRAIYAAELILKRDDQHWSALFDLAGIKPLRILYEDLARDYSATTREVLTWLGVGDRHGTPIPSPRLMKQADSTSEISLKQYRTYKSQMLDSRASLTRAQPGRCRTRGLVRAECSELGTLIELSSAWWRWLTRNREKGMSDEEIVQILGLNGYGPSVVYDALARYRPGSE